MGRNKTLDILKIVAFAGVVYLHMATPTTSIEWLFNCLSRIGVPIFFAVSGFFSYNSNAKKILKRLKKILVLFAVSLCFYLLISILNIWGGSDAFFANLNNKSTYINFILFNQTGAVGHLWFLPALVYVYAIVLVTKKLKISNKAFYSISILLFAFMFITKEIFGLFEPDAPYFRTWLFMGIPCFSLGLFVRENEEKFKKKKTSGLAIGSLIAALLSYGECLLFGWQEIYASTYVLVFCLFVLAIKYPASQTDNPSAQKLFATAAKIGNQPIMIAYVIHLAVRDEIMACMGGSIATASECAQSLITSPRWELWFLTLVVSILLGVASSELIKSLRKNDCENQQRSLNDYPAEKNSAELYSAKNTNRYSHEVATCKRCFTPRLIICTLALSAYVSIVFVLGYQLDTNSAVEWRLLTVAKIISAMILVSPICLFVLKPKTHFIKGWEENSNVKHAFKDNESAECRANSEHFPPSETVRRSHSSNYKSTKNIAKGKNGCLEPTRRLKIIAVFILAVPQFVMFLIMFPGLYAYDGGNHVLQFLNSIVPLRTQYSVLYSALLGTCINIGKSVGSTGLGLSIAMIIQASFSIYALYKLCIFVLDRSKSFAFFVATLLFSALFPFALITRISTCQDVLFGTFFLLALIELTKLGSKITNNETITAKNMLPLCVWCVLMMLMRNNGAYAFLVMIVLAIPYLVRHKQKKLLAAGLISIAAFYAISGPFFSALGVSGSKVTIREMSSIPSQQMARALEEHPERFNDDEILIYTQAYNTEAYGYAPTDCSWYWGQSEISDVAKDRLNQNYVKNDLGKYLKLYVSIGLKCPKSYVDAFLMNSLGFWYPAKNYPDTRMYHPYVEYQTSTGTNINPNYIDIPRTSLIPAIDNKIAEWFKSTSWNDIPVLSIGVKSGFYFILFVTCMMAAISRKRADLTLPILMTLGLIVTYFLSPVCLFRYIYPLVISIPLFFLVFTNKTH